MQPAQSHGPFGLNPRSAGRNGQEAEPRRNGPSWGPPRATPTAASPKPPTNTTNPTTNSGAGTSSSKIRPRHQLGSWRPGRRSAPGGARHHGRGCIGVAATQQQTESKAHEQQGDRRRQTASRPASKQHKAVPRRGQAQRADLSDQQNNKTRGRSREQVQPQFAARPAGNHSPPSTLCVAEARGRNRWFTGAHPRRRVPSRRGGARCGVLFRRYDFFSSPMMAQRNQPATAKQPRPR